ncbi:MAG: hypothetical protein U9N09_07585 [Euryarchaeota archaeon]|nr:hypothetical protein [Euryarchaeota archaeon]
MADLELGSKIRAIIDRNGEAEDVKRLKMEYGDKIEVKYIPREDYGTCRQILFDHDWALDGKEILLSDRSGPSYISTIYIKEKDFIALLRNNFENIWKTHSPR